MSAAAAKRGKVAISKRNATAKKPAQRAERTRITAVLEEDGARRSAKKRKVATVEPAAQRRRRVAAAAATTASPDPVGGGRPRASKKSAPGARRGKAARLPRAQPLAVLERLDVAIPAPHVELAFEDAWQLVVAVILSAQSTDRRVNMVTPVLFGRWPTPADLARAPAEAVEEVIKSTGFFRNKTKAIRACSQMIVERFGGEVPRKMAELLELPGVARKTANVVLGAAYGLAEGVVTDTHAMRVARRLGFTDAEAPEKVEADLCRKFPPTSWLTLSHQLVLHGRYVCTARAPDCGGCPLNELCPSRQAPAEHDWRTLAGYEAKAMAERAQGFHQLHVGRAAAAR